MITLRSRISVLLALIAIACTATLLLSSAASASSSNAVPGIDVASLEASPTPTTVNSAPLFTQEWQTMIDKIEQAKGRGELTVDEAARLRLTALLEPQALPAAFRPTPDELQSLVQVEPPGYRDGEAALAGPMKALYFDQDLWSAETKAYVESRLVAADAQSLDYSQPAVYSTAHFDIHFDLDPASPDYPGDPGGPYTAISYTLELASALEDTWNIYDDPAQFDFLMPDPTTYFYDALVVCQS